MQNKFRVIGVLVGKIADLSRIKPHSAYLMDRLLDLIFKFWSGERGYLVLRDSSKTPSTWAGCGTKESGLRFPYQFETEGSRCENRSLFRYCLNCDFCDLVRKSRESEFPPTMDLVPEQHFVYAWRYTDDTVCKLGVSTLRSFYARIKAAKTVTYQDIELLGIEVFGTETEARTAYQRRLKTFARVADRRAWVHFDAVVRQWTGNRVRVQSSDPRCF